jgi:SAM-dependent methyltransferase
MVASATFLALAAVRGGHGLAMHLRAWRMGSSILLGPRDPVWHSIAYDLLLRPMDSVRYFELDFAWKAAQRVSSLKNYVDISSPRLLPVAVVRDHPDVQATLVNPDPRDLEVTRALVDSLGIGKRCRLESRRMDQMDLAPGSVDLVTSISVVEHIPSGSDLGAVARMWSWVRPGGRFVLTVPCAREAFEEVADHDEYGLMQPDETGLVLRQRFYDQEALAAGFFRICGPPRRVDVFGERTAGIFLSDRDLKARGGERPEREPYSVATGYRLFASIDELPGIGVIAMEFEKPSDG